MRLVALLVALLAFWFAFDSATLVDPSGDDDGAHQARATAVRHAIERAIPGARDLQPGGVSEVFGERSRSGPRVSFLFRYLKQFDWSDVTFRLDTDGGPVRAILDQADQHRDVLQTAGFQPVRARGWGSGSRSDAQPTAPPPPGSTSRRPGVHVTVSHQSKSPTGRGQGSGGYMMDLNDPRLLHHRIYVHPSSGAVVFSRIEFDQATRLARIELTYSDRTIMGVDYGETAYTMSEWIE